MAVLHQKSISPAWPKNDMATHCQQDICIGIGYPLQGFIIARKTQDQAEILTIVTDPNHRQIGLGRLLLSAAEQQIFKDGGEIVFLEVAQDNKPAIALYKSHNYEQFGIRPAYYKRPNGRVGALTFRKRLDA